MTNLKATNLSGEENKPEILKKIEKTLQILYPDISHNIITNILIERIAQMLTAKRITLDEAKGTVIPNWFSLIFLKSGGGKDRLVNDIDRFIFKSFREWYINQAISFYQTQADGYSFVNTEKEVMKGENNATSNCAF